MRDLTAVTVHWFFFFKVIKESQLVSCLSCPQSHHHGLLICSMAFFLRDGKPTGSALMVHIDAFKHSLEERMAETGIRNGWKCDGYKRGLLIQEVCSSERVEKMSPGFLLSGLSISSGPCEI